MVLWTVIPIEMVMADPYQQPVFEDIEYAGVTVTVEKLGPVQSRIVRLISTDPQDFLREDIQPGMILTYQPMSATV